MGELIYNGKSSRAIGLEVETYPNYFVPRRSYEKIKVPGRNGDLLIDNGSWENGKRTYEVSIGSFTRHYYDMAIAVSTWLHSSNATYSRLEDSYEPDYYRLAAYLNDFDLSNLFNHGGRATLEFDCKPQRFLKTGDTKISFSKSSSILNPTGFPSLPIITVYGTGTGTLKVGDCSVTILNIKNQIIVDSEIQDAYLNDTNRNSEIETPNGFPKLNPGLTKIEFSGGITKVDVVPKWFTL